MIKIIAIILLCSSCAIARMQKTTWIDSINNPENQEFVEEVAFNKNIPTSHVTQAQFNERYLLK